MSGLGYKIQKHVSIKMCHHIAHMPFCLVDLVVVNMNLTVSQQS